LTPNKSDNNSLVFEHDSENYVIEPKKVASALEFKNEMVGLSDKFAKIPYRDITDYHSF